jgi:toxin ParE1/3/4
MLRVEWSTPAADEFEAAQDYYFGVNPTVARMLAQRVDASIRMQRARPAAGRVGLREGTREWAVQRSPYLLVYRITRDALQILHVWCAGQDWTNRAD